MSWYSAPGGLLLLAFRGCRAALLEFAVATLGGVPTELVELVELRHPRREVLADLMRPVPPRARVLFGPGDPVSGPEEVDIGGQARPLLEGQGPSLRALAITERSLSFRVSRFRWPDCSLSSSWPRATPRTTARGGRGVP